MNELGMFGKPIYATNNEIVRRRNWKQDFNINGNRIYIQFCDGSKNSCHYAEITYPNLQLLCRTSSTEIIT